MSKTIRILAIEDSEDDALLILHQIRKEGYTIDYKRVDTAEEMKSALKEKSWDIILSDYRMPHFNGLEALAVLKESGIDLPFIIISGTIGEEVAVEAMKAGAHDYIMKNNLQRLLPAIERELRESKSRAEQKLSEKQIALLNFSLDHVNETAFLCNETGRLIYVNYEACRALGYNREELVSKEVTGIIAEYTSQQWQNHVQILRTSGSFTFETNLKTRNENIFPVEINVSRFEYDSSAYILAMSRNITERKRAEKELYRLNRELQAISNCNLTLLRTEDEQTLLNQICHIICDEAGYRMAWVGYAEDNETKTVRPIAWAGREDGYLAEVKTSWGNSEQGNGPVGSAIRSGESVYIQDLSKDAQFTPWVESALQRGYRSGFTLPLKDENAKVFGVLMIYSSETNAITPEEIRLMEELAGDLAFGIITLRNRAERKRAEEALHLSEERFSKIFKLSPIAIVICRVDDGCIVDVNDVFEKETGYTREEIIGHTTNELQLYADAETRNNILQLLREKGSIINYEFKNRHKSGRTGTALNTTIEINLGGEKHFLSSLLDITDRKQAENDLRKLSRAVEQSPASIIITDLNGNIEYVNSKFTEVTGYTMDEALGQNSRFLKSGETSPETYRQLWQTITSGKEWSGELRNRKKNGELYWEHASISPIFDTKGNITHLLAVKEDVTLRKQTELELIKAKEKAEESDRLKTSFLCNMSHEIRTPMNAIVGFAGFLLEPNLSEAKRLEYSRIIRDRTYDLLRIVEDILDISKIEVGQLRIIESSINLEEVMNELLEFYRLKLQNQEHFPNLTLKLSLASNLRGLKIQTDGYRLKQILNNLLDNAFKYTSKGSIEFGGQMNQDNDLLFFVKDTGIGIPENKRDIIFDRFRQADDLMNTRRYGGTGLGLSIVKGLVTLMNGKTWLESEVGAGSTFYFTLPLKVSAKDKQFFQENKTNDLQAWRDKVIMVVEDDLANAEYLKEVLSGKGLQILLAHTGEESLQLLNNTPHINAILMDIRLPDTNGLTLTRIIKNYHPEIFIIAQTAYASQEDVNQCIAAGCNDYLSKPIDTQQLISAINKAIAVA